MNLEQVQKAQQEYGNKVLLTPKGKFQSTISLGDWIFLKTWKEGSLTDQLRLKWRGLYQVVQVPPMTVKLLGVDECIFLE